MTDLFDTDCLVDAEPPIDRTDTHLPNLYVGLEIPLLAPGDGIVTERHHASADRYEADNSQNQIRGQISPFALSGWLRHGCEAVIQAVGATACHPGAASADDMLGDVYDRDLEAGYHEKGACTDDDNSGCILYDLFGDFGDQPGKLLRRPVSFSPNRRQVDVTDGEAEAHYRQLHTQIRSRNEGDGGQPLRHTTRDVVGNLVGTWKLTFRVPKPEFVGLLLEAVSFLDSHSDEFAFQCGGARNFGAGMIDAQVINPLYTETELRRLYNRAQSATTAMEKKDELWESECRAEFTNAFQARLAARSSAVSMPGDGA